MQGFKVLMDDGNELTVSLKDYPHPELSLLPDNTSPEWVPKEGGCPSSCPLHKREYQDEK
jgi:hypothetical protein